MMMRTWTIECQRAHPGLTRCRWVSANKGMLYMPELPTHSGIKKQILHEAHYSRFIVHPGLMKMYHGVYKTYC